MKEAGSFKVRGMRGTPGLANRARRGLVVPLIRDKGGGDESGFESGLDQGWSRTERDSIELDLL